MISIKDAFKCLFNEKLCKESNRFFDHNGIQVNLFFEYDAEQEEIEILNNLVPICMENNKKRYQLHICNGNRLEYICFFNCKNDIFSNCRSSRISRNMFEKHFFPQNLDLVEFDKIVPCPPRIASSQIKLSKYTITGPTVFIAGRYRKISRNLSQTPWILNGKRMKDGSIQETITHVLSPFFGIDLNETHKVIFISSGREDIDVRTLGEGRPFALQMIDVKKCSLPKCSAEEMELQIEQTKEVSVQRLQTVNR